MIVGKKLSNYFELIKPLIEFKFELIRLRSNNVFEIATQEEIDKLGATSRSGEKSSSNKQFSDDINLEEVKLAYYYNLFFLFLLN